jgi:hypothetical protein
MAFIFTLPATSDITATLKAMLALSFWLEAYFRPFKNLNDRHYGAVIIAKKKTQTTYQVAKKANVAKSSLM